MTTLQVIDIILSKRVEVQRAQVDAINSITEQKEFNK